MSEFYTIRRDNITDLTAFFGFLVGFIGAAPYAYSFIRVGFETATIVKGFALFITITMGAGVLAAMAGLAVGRGIGWFWERGHRILRQARGQEFAAEDMGVRRRLAPLDAALPARPVDPADATAAAAATIEYREGIDARSFAALVARAGLADLDPARTTDAMARTTNIGAWDGSRLVGAVRVLSDGYAWSVVTDLVVDPRYRRRGIGRELVSRAARSSSGTLSIARIPPGTEGFFRQVDLMPAYQGAVRGPRSRVP
jgi:GNAT superfamily N-acetyltransferase